MSRTNQRKTPDRRSYTEDFKREAVEMFLDGHSAQSIVDRLEEAGPVGEVLDSRVLGREPADFWQFECNTAGEA